MIRRQSISLEKVMRNFTFVMLVLSISGCATHRIENLDIPDPSAAKTLEQHLANKFVEPVDRGNGWNLYKVYTDFNNGKCSSRKSPKRPKVDVQTSYLVNLLKVYAEEKNMYLIHTSQSSSGISSSMIYNRYLVSRSKDNIASYDYASRLLSQPKLTRAVKSALDKEAYDSKTKYNDNAKERFGEIFFLSSSPDLMNVTDAVIVSQHTRNWLTTDRQCRYDEFHYSLFQVHKIAGNYISELSHIEEKLLAKEGRDIKTAVQIFEKDIHMWNVAKSRYDTRIKMQKSVGEMVGSSDNVMAYVEAVSGEKVKLSIIGKISNKRDYYLFIEKNSDSTLYPKDTKIKNMWDQQSRWARIDYELNFK